MFRFLLLMSIVGIVTCFDDEAWLKGEEEKNDAGFGDVMDEEEVQSILKKYDIDDSGDLSKEELELGQAEILEVMKQKMKEKNYKHPNTEKEEVVEEQNTKSTKDGEDSQTYYIMITIFVGVVVIVIVIATNRQQSPNMSPETDSLMLKRREEWLDKVSNQNLANKDKEDKKPSVQERGQKTSNAAATNKTDSKEAVDSRVLQSKEIQDGTLLPATSEQSMSVEKNIDITRKETSESHVPNVSENVNREVEKTTLGKARNVKIDHDTNSSKPAFINTAEDIPSVTQSVHHKEKLPREKGEGEATIDKDILVQFLTDILDCNVNVSISSKTRYSLASLTIHTKDIPETVDDIPVCLTHIVQNIVPRQISRIKYCVKCYSACEECEPNYNDTLVCSASDWLRDYCVDVVLTNLMKESKKSEEDDLWSDYDDKHTASEAVNFLWRIAGWAEDGVVVSDTLLSRLLQCPDTENADDVGEDNSAVTFLTMLLQAAGQQLSNVKRMDEVILSEGKTLRSLEILLANPLAGAVMGVALQKEVLEASQGLGNYFEKSSLFGPLLAVSTVPTKFLQKRQLTLTGNSVAPFTSLRGFPRVTEDDVKRVESSIQEGLHRCQNIVYSGLKKVVTSKPTREQGLSWISCVISLNELRTSALLQNDSQIQACCTDAYMLNFCGMLLEFFLPIHNDVDKLAKVDLEYSTSDACRLNYDFETCLAGGQIVSDKSQDRGLGQLPRDLQTKHNFITECFHLCQRSLSVGVIPTIVHYNRMQRDFLLKIEAMKGSPREEELRNQHILLTLMWDTCLCDEELIRNVSIFYLSQARLLLQLLEKSGQGACTDEEKVRVERKAFSKIPEYCVKDMAIWFRFVATHAIHVHRGVLQGLPISNFVDCCVSLLDRPDLMPGPIPASKMVSCLLQFLNTSKNTHSRGWGSGVMSDLAVMVETCPSVQNQLGPALLRTYTSVDVVEGLDVDKDEFDKYSARSEIGKLIEHLWRRADCRTSIIEQCQTDLFQSFLGAILDTLLYMLHDSLSRLANIKKIEVAKQNEAEWNALTMKEKMDKEQFLRNEEHVGKGFMAMANKTLEFIDLLTRAEEVARCFTRQPLAKRSASVICGFLDSLCGSRAKDFKVKDFEKYNFSPQNLLLQIMTTLLRVSVEVTSSNDSFLVCMATDADFDGGNLDKAYSVISSKGLAEEDTLTQFDTLIQQLKQMNTERQSEEKKDASDDINIMEVLESVRVDKERVVEEYTRCMADRRFLPGEIQDDHSFQSNFQSLDPRSPKVKALMKEMKQLQQNLPIHPDASICVVQDEERIDVMRAMLTGPVGTPYSLGCFVFDVYFPASYPNSAPLVKIITTGGGTVRFNPNLYSDGKVCLSLLGTWHGGDASEKWNPGKSSIYQVLVSIQSLILIPEPMFNEPGYEGMKGTAEGDRQSIAYNWKIRLNTLRHAILGQLRNPPLGLEKVIRRHLAVQKECVMRQCREWLGECEDEDQEKRMRQVVAGIYAELKDLQMEEDQDELEEDQDVEDED